MTVARRAPVSMRFSRQRYWSGLAISFSKGSPHPKDRTRVFCTAGRVFTGWATRGERTLNWLMVNSTSTHAHVKLIRHTYFLLKRNLRRNSFFVDIYLFKASLGVALDLCRCVQASSSCGAWASHCRGFSCCQLRASVPGKEKTSNAPSSPQNNFLKWRICLTDQDQPSESDWEDSSRFRPWAPLPPPPTSPCPSQNLRSDLADPVAGLLPVCLLLGMLFPISFSRKPF